MCVYNAVNIVICMESLLFPFSQQDPTYEEVETSRTVHYDTNFIMMEKNVAYDSVDLKI